MFFKKGVQLMSWVNALTIGWFFGFVLLLVLSQVFELIGIKSEQFILGLAMGFGVSFAEWQALKTKGVSFRWILLCSLGLALPFLVQSLIGFEFPPSYEYAVLPIMIGLGSMIVGLTQYTLIRSMNIKIGSSVQFTMMAWLLPVCMINGASLIPNDALPKIVLFFINLFAILAAGPVYAIVKYQLFKTQFGSETTKAE
ncbi:MAG: hypothetical protein JNM67_06895 [Bacteroidetes bacterium]|jgi:hypothetical protein|nr:hypothetical protein [Bacteroidota bacterium]